VNGDEYRHDAIDARLSVDDSTVPVVATMSVAESKVNNPQARQSCMNVVNVLLFWEYRLLHRPTADAGL